jgi:hypothetical protein
MSDCDRDREIESSFERAVSPAWLRKWIKKQEGMIDLAFRKADAAGNSAKGHELLQVAIRAQGELIALAAPKSEMKSKPPTEPESDADDSDALIAQMEPMDLSHMSVEQLEKLAGAKPPSNAEKASSTSPATAERKPSSKRGRPKGHEVSGAAKEAKERAAARRVHEEREREARTRQMRRYDAANTWPMPTIPEEWGDE